MTPPVGFSHDLRKTVDRSRCPFGMLATEAGVRRRFAPHQLRHAHAVEMARD